MTGTLIQDTEIAGSESFQGIRGGGFTARRVNIHGFEDGIEIRGRARVLDSYISLTDFLYPDGTVPHFDAVSGWSVNGVVVRHNTLTAPPDQTSAVNFTNDFGPITNVLIADNVLSGGGYALYVRGDGLSAQGAGRGPARDRCPGQEQPVRDEPVGTRVGGGCAHRRVRQHRAGDRPSDVDGLTPSRARRGSERLGAASDAEQCPHLDERLPREVPGGDRQRQPRAWSRARLDECDGQRGHEETEQRDLDPHEERCTGERGEQDADDEARGADRERRCEQEQRRLERGRVVPAKERLHELLRGRHPARFVADALVPAVLHVPVFADRSRAFSTCRGTIPSRQRSSVYQRSSDAAARSGSATRVPVAGPFRCRGGGPTSRAGPGRAGSITPWTANEASIAWSRMRVPSAASLRAWSASAPPASADSQASKKPRLDDRIGVDHDHGVPRKAERVLDTRLPCCGSSRLFVGTPFQDERARRCAMLAVASVHRSAITSTWSPTLRSAQTAWSVFAITQLFVVRGHEHEEVHMRRDARPVVPGRRSTRWR